MQAGWYKRCTDTNIEDDIDTNAKISTNANTDTSYRYKIVLPISNLPVINIKSNNIAEISKPVPYALNPK